MKDRAKIDKNFETNGLTVGTVIVNTEGSWELLPVAGNGRAMFRNLTTNKRAHYSQLVTPIGFDMLNLPDDFPR